MHIVGGAAAAVLAVSPAVTPLPPAAAGPGSRAGAALEDRTLTQPRLIAIRAHHHHGVDRVAFIFDGATPTHVRAHYVDRLIADGSGLPIRIAGNDVLQVDLEPTTWTEPAPVPRREPLALPDVITVVRSGAFEGVTSFGIGLLSHTAFRVITVPARDRVLVDVRTPGRTVMRRVYYFNRERYLANREPFYVPRLRPVRALSPANDALQRLFAGPLARERTHGLRLLRSGATGFSHLTIRRGVARVRLLGHCDSHGSTVTVAGEIAATLRQVPSVRWVKIYDPAGRTASPEGPSDSIPECLNP